MQAYRLEKLGSLDGIVLRDEPEPSPRPTEIVVRIRATSLNRRDTAILSGTYPLPSKPGIVPLSDGAGEVVAVGERVSRFKPGDRVTGSYFPRWRPRHARPHRPARLHPRRHADRICGARRTMGGRGAGSSFLGRGGDAHCAGVTAWSTLTGSQTLQPGQTVLVLGTGGVSLFALQFAKLMGCRVIATTSRTAKVEKLRTLGADHVVNSAETPEWASAVRDLTGGRGVDLVAETMGPETIGHSLAATALYGRIVLLITTQGQKQELVLPGQSYARSRATVSRVFVGSRASLEAMNAAIAVHQLRPSSTAPSASPRRTKPTVISSKATSLEKSSSEAPETSCKGEKS
jgi:NADPH:quinone reductase-like Zn-dependent oxidoreductase